MYKLQMHLLTQSLLKQVSICVRQEVSNNTTITIGYTTFSIRRDSGWYKSWLIDRNARQPIYTYKH